MAKNGCLLASSFCMMDYLEVKKCKCFYFGFTTNEISLLILNLRGHLVVPWDRLGYFMVHRIILSRLLYEITYCRIKEITYYRIK